MFVFKRANANQNILQAASLNISDRQKLTFNSKQATSSVIS